MSDQRHGAGERREMRRVGDMLGPIASELGIEEELRLARRMSAWERLVEELLPAASGSSHLLAVQPPALVVSATDNVIAQELRLRQAELLASFARLPDGVRLIELRVVVRPDGQAGRPR
jgi:Dna[CI] antecedent, DciA